MRAVLIVAAGNRFRRDDGAGLAVARRLRDRLSAETRILEREGNLFALLDEWVGEDLVVLLDAISSGAEPGTIHRLDVAAGRLPPGLSQASTHGFGVAEVIELGRAMGRLPARLVVYGIEGRDFSTGEGLSAEVATAVDQLVDLMATEARA